MMKGIRTTGLAVTGAAALLLATAAWAGPRAVYTATNAPGENQVLVFHRGNDGTLAAPRAFSTGGMGTGADLGNQQGLALSGNGKWLAVVNAGSDEVSIFKVRKKGLKLEDVAASGGRNPVSVAIHGDLLYVLNAGGVVGDVDGIAGFRIGKKGRLDPLGGSVRPLSQDSTQPAQIGFSPDGQVLAVTEKATNKVDTYVVDGDGYADGPFVHDAPGQTPFGFAFGTRSRLFVTEAFPGQMDAAAVSVYAAGSDGSLDVLSASVPTTETAACWIAVTSGARYAYTANTPNATLTGFAIGSGGSLSLLSSDGVSAMTGMGSAPVDLAVSGDDRFLYSLDSGSHSIGAFTIGPDGSLAPLGTMGGLPPSANGLAAR